MQMGTRGGRGATRSSCCNASQHTQLTCPAHETSWQMGNGPRRLRRCLLRLATCTRMLGGIIPLPWAMTVDMLLQRGPHSALPILCGSPAWRKKQAAAAGSCSCHAALPTSTLVVLLLLAPLVALLLFPGLEVQPLSSALALVRPAPPLVAAAATRMLLSLAAAGTLVAAGVHMGRAIGVAEALDGL